MIKANKTEPLLTIRKGKVIRIHNKEELIDNIIAQSSNSNYIIIRNEDVIDKDIKKFYIGTHNSNIISLQLFQQIKNFKILDSTIFNCKQCKHFTKKNKNLLEVTFNY